MKEICSLNGEITDSARAVIPATDDGLLRGDGAFEVLRMYEGTPYALVEHLERLANSCAALRLPVALEQFEVEIASLLAQAGSVDALLRLVVTRGGNRIAFVEPLPALADSVRLGSVTYSPTRLLDGVKSLSYAANMLATRLAQERGSDEALLVTPHGRILEGPTSSFFWIKDGQLFTPPLSDRILSSITRLRMLEVTDAVEQILTTDGLTQVDEACLVSTVRELQPVSRIDRRELPAAHPVVDAAGRLLRERIAAELAQG